MAVQLVTVVLIAMLEPDPPETQVSLFSLLFHKYLQILSSRLQLPALIVPSQSRVVLDHKLHLLTLAYSLQSPKVCTRLDRLLR